MFQVDEALGESQPSSQNWPHTSSTQWNKHSWFQLHPTLLATAAQEQPAVRTDGRLTAQCRTCSPSRAMLISRCSRSAKPLAKLGLLYPDPHIPDPGLHVWQHAAQRGHHDGGVWLVPVSQLPALNTSNSVGHGAAPAPLYHAVKKTLSRGDWHPDHRCRTVKSMPLLGMYEAR